MAIVNKDAGIENIGCKSIISLDGQWQLRRIGGDEALSASVPGCVHLDLERAGLIEDPFYGDNEYRVAWVHESDWEYSRTFTVDNDLLAHDKVYLECEGLDTLAKITVNGLFVAETDNMYISHRLDVKSILKPGENTIVVEFKSATEFVKPLMEKDHHHCPTDSVPGAPYVRKSPSQFGWDWGPKMPTAGIWRPIRLAGYSHARLDDVWVRQKHDNGKVTLDIEVSFDQYRDEDCQLNVTLTHPDGHEQKVAVDSGLKCSLTVENPQLWWTNGYGDQPLYKVCAAMECGGEIVSTFSRRIGLRTLELDQTKDEFGTRFQFVVNGIPIFSKGADWIPADQFPSRLTYANYFHLINSAKIANMNMLRVWGGGFYEDEMFYDLCDEMGILVWQDFMFACSTYPTDAAFLKNVEYEAQRVVVNMRNRACLAIWCGNNEIEVGVGAWWPEVCNDLRKAEYRTIFAELLPKVVAEFDPDTEYWRSSPCSGEEGVFVEMESENFGDAHYWGVWHGRRPVANFRKQFFRFSSEFGMQSFPAYETCKTYAPQDQLNPMSYIMDCHQKCHVGSVQIMYYVAELYRLPKNFEMLCYATQIMQGTAIRYAVEHWRQNRGRCMGSLYWQFNDCWPGQSWASVDYFGRWKAMQYMAKRFYKPIMLSIREEGNTAEIHITNDTVDPICAKVKWTLEKLDGTSIRQGTIDLKAAALANTLAGTLDFTQEIDFDTRRQAVLVTELVVDGSIEGLTMTSFVHSKHLELPKASIKLQTGADACGAFVEVSSDLAARYVCLSIPGSDVIFSDNYFDLPAGRKVVIRLEGDVDPALLTKAQAFSLVDSY